MIVFEEVCKEVDLFEDGAKQVLIDTLVKQKNHQECFDRLLSEFDTTDLSDDCKKWITYNFARTYILILRDREIITNIYLAKEEIDRVAEYHVVAQEANCDEGSKFIDHIVDISNTKGNGFIETLYEIWIAGIVTGIVEAVEL